MLFFTVITVAGGLAAVADTGVAVTAVLDVVATGAFIFVIPAVVVNVTDVIGATAVDAIAVIIDDVSGGTVVDDDVAATTAVAGVIATAAVAVVGGVIAVPVPVVANVAAVVPVIFVRVAAALGVVAASADVVDMNVVVAVVSVAAVINICCGCGCYRCCC